MCASFSARLPTTADERRIRKKKENGIINVSEGKRGPSANGRFKQTFPFNELLFFFFFLMALKRKEGDFVDCVYMPLFSSPLRSEANKACKTRR